MMRLCGTVRTCSAWLLLALAGCGADRPRPEAGPVPLRVAINSDIRGTNPGVTRDSNTDAVMHHLVESLVAYREDLTVAPQLAETIEVSPDGRTFSFRLRDRLRFHNGVPVTSSEVAWSWRRILDPKTGFRCRSWYDGTDPTGLGARIVAIETPDSRTVVFRLDRRNPLFLEQMASPQCLTGIVHPRSVAADGAWRTPIGTGPYKLAAWRRGEYVELTRFEDYAPRDEAADGYAGGRHPLATRVRFVIIPDAAVGKAALEAGDIDILPHVPPNLLEEGRRGRLLESAANQLSWDVLLMQTADPLLADPRMREAIARAIDVRQVAAIATLGRSMANPSAVPRVSPFHSTEHDGWLSYDPARARVLLKAAGYRGQPIRIQTNRKYPLLFDDAVAIQAMLASVGIDARLEVLDWATQLSNYSKGAFQLSTFGYSARAHPALNYAAFVGSKASSPNMQWDDPEARALLREAGAAADRDEQRRGFERLHRLMEAQIPIIGLYNERTVDLVRPDIEGYRNWPLGAPRLWDVRRKQKRG